MIITRKYRDYIIEFAFRPHLVAAVKELGAKFMWNEKTWKISVDRKADVEAFAKKYKFEMPDENAIPEPEQDFEVNPLPELGIEIPLKRKLFDYQRTGVAYAIEKKRCIIGDKPGLGKTGQAIAAVTALNAFPCLVICPNSPLKENWVDEWKLWTNKKAIVITDQVWRNMDTWIKTDTIQVFVIHYQGLKKYMVDDIASKSKRFKWTDVKFNKKINLFNSVVIDESHNIKDTKTQKYKFCRGIAHGKEVIYELSGTAVINKPMDLVGQLTVIDRLPEFGGYTNFKQRYCAGMKEASNLKELNKKLTDNCFYSRNKEDVLKDLPDKIRNVVYCDIDPESRIEYNAAATDLESYLVEYRQQTDEQVKRSMRGEAMVRIGILKKISARGKLADVREFINATLENEKLGVFMLQHDIVDEMMQHYPDALCITGRQSMEERVENKRRFQEVSEDKLIFLGLKTANEGITLTAASHCGFVELPWHAAAADQCEDRFHRIGQKDSVRCTYFLGRNTIDLWCYFDVIEAKRSMAMDVLGGNQDAVETHMIDSFMAFMDNQKQKVAA